MTTDSLNEALTQWFACEIGRAYRALERHRPDLAGRCTGCTTQLAAAPWPCRICRVAANACERARPPADPSDRPFLAAIEANATSQTVPMRAVPRTPSTAPGISAGRVPTHGKKN